MERVEFHHINNVIKVPDSDTPAITGWNIILNFSGPYKGEPETRQHLSITTKLAGGDRERSEMTSEGYKLAQMLKSTPWDSAPASFWATYAGQNLAQMLESHGIRNDQGENVHSGNNEEYRAFEADTLDENTFKQIALMATMTCNYLGDRSVGHLPPTWAEKTQQPSSRRAAGK